MEPTLLFWIIACIAFILIEALTQQFVALWFVAGGIVAIILSLFNVNFQYQLLLFVLVSLITFISLRPLVKKHMTGKFTATNSDSNIGEMAIVTMDFDETFEGRILVNNMDWAAKSVDLIKFKKGDHVVIERIEGVKCLVRKA